MLLGRKGGFLFKREMIASHGEMQHKAAINV